MRVLVLNVGSTSVKYDLYDMATETRLDRGATEHIAGEAAVATAIVALLDRLADQAIDAVGHRVVHGGERHVRPVAIDDTVEAAIAEAAVFAPLHNPLNLLGIRTARARLPAVPHVAVFDTAFHATLPPHAFMYPLPHALYAEHGIRRYGFHGPSHQYMVACAAEELRTAPARLRLVTCHLGGGSSVAAIAGGLSVDTSMGATPLEGLAMGTRSGDLDPAIPILLARQGMTTDAIEELLVHRSGLAGLSGLSGDFRELEEHAALGHAGARLALEVYEHRLRKYIGAYAATLGGVDAVVFTGGIGEHAAALRWRVCEGLGFMGIALDRARNAAARPADTRGIVDVSEAHARTRTLVVHTEEERMIAREVVRCLGGSAIRSAHGLAIPVGISVRHVHLSRRECDALFGEGHELVRRRDVSQPGQFVARETVDVIGPHGELRGVAIVGPLRDEAQIELARTDAIHLGITPPVRLSGELADTPGARLRGPCGEVTLARGAIVARRHVHMSPADARRFEVADGDVISARVEGERELVLGDIVVRVHDDFSLDLHLDTDEANAAGLDGHGVIAFAGVERRG